MSPTIKITKAKESRVNELDFENIPFGRVFTDHMFSADFIDGEWKNFEIAPLKPMLVHPGNLAWHYGQSIFEGMKATKHIDGTPLLFRPELHSDRLNSSARRMCMPEFPKDVFMKAIHSMVSLESNWIPPQAGSALYIRPLMFATDEAIGVRASDNYKFLIMTLPAGPYYERKVNLKVAMNHVRACDGGVGQAKTAGNYAASLYPAVLAQKEGYDQVMWMDAKEFKYIQEVGTMNIFFVIDGVVITPATTGTILKGITRRSCIEILESEGYKIEERNLSIDEVVEAYDNGKLEEVFGTGTAAVIALINKIGYKDKIMQLPEENHVGDFLKNYINGLRNGTVKDKFGWVVPADVDVLLSQFSKKEVI
jgi:branched-chain amino acid aminotransferase